ncbi:unnamed protein product [Mucor hiemalis]
MKLYPQTRLTLSVLVTSILILFGSITLILYLSTITNVKHILHQTIATYVPTLLNNTFQYYFYLILSLFPLFHLYETFNKYQLLLKQHTLHTYQLCFTIGQDIDVNQSSQEFGTKAPDVTTHHHTQKPRIPVDNAPARVSVPLEKIKTIKTEQDQHCQPKQKSTLDRTISTEWTVVREKKRHSTVVPPKPIITKDKRRNSTPTSKNSKSSCKRQNTKSPAASPVSDNCKITKTLNSNHLPWSDIVKSQEDESLDRDDVPHLSDSDSIAGSVESPCMPHIDLFHYPITAAGAGMVEKENRYYSPFFSTAFDFGVLPPCQTQAQPQVISNHFTVDNRLDEYLNSQQPYCNGNKQYTPTSVTRHQRSILDLLKQSQHVETTITPTSFSYFDDMMMSTSLYKSDQNVNKYPLLMSKRDWNSISHHIH